LATRPKTVCAHRLNRAGEPTISDAWRRDLRHRAAVVAGEEGRTDRDERTDEEGNRTAPWTGDQTVRVAVRGGDEEHGAEQTSNGVSEWRTHM